MSDFSPSDAPGAACQTDSTALTAGKPLGARDAGADFYMDGGLVVFTAAYLLRQGRCCGSGCRHCPFGWVNVPDDLRRTKGLACRPPA